MAAAHAEDRSRGWLKREKLRAMRKTRSNSSPSRSPRTLQRKKFRLPSSNFIPSRFIFAARLEAQLMEAFTRQHQVCALSFSNRRKMYMQEENHFKCSRLALIRSFYSRYRRNNA